MKSIVGFAELLALLVAVFGVLIGSVMFVGWTNGFLRVGPPNYNTNRHIRLWSVRKVAP